MGFKETETQIRTGLVWLDTNAKHAIELKESFTYPAYDKQLRNTIKGTKNTRFYGICLNAMYFEFVMTMTRMYDSREKDTACFGNIFKWLTNDFVAQFELNNNKEIRQLIISGLAEYKKIKGSHVISGLRTVRNKMYAHTSISINRKQIAKFGYAENLLEDTLPLLNVLNNAIFGKEEPYDRIKYYWAGYSKIFWDNFVN